MVERLKEKIGLNQPIFTSEILEIMSDYSRPRVFQLIKKAVSEEKLIKYAKGVYYIPYNTRYGKSVISVEQVVIKKYIANMNNVYGIYSGLHMQQNFMLTYQVPNAIEVITNNETMSVRETKIRNRKVILRKSRFPITKENSAVYTILELFTSIDVKKYLSDNLVKNEVKNYIKSNNINVKDVFELVSSFPSKTIKNMMKAGIINELA